jgi:Mg-chelatase subunit ChlD
MQEGIRELVSQGVTIEGRDIRFDDFVALSSAQVPGPPSGDAVAVHYGLAPMPDHLKDTRQATHYFEIAIRTADTAPETSLIEEQSPSANYMFVVDTSGSMEGEKLDSVKIAIRELFEELRDDDRIGIITFNDTAQTLFPATTKQDIDLPSFIEDVSQMTADGGTDINLGLGFGIAELEPHSDRDSINHIFLFTDGNPTSGETGWLNIRRNAAEAARGKDIRLSTYAFGSDANTRELDRLAGVTGGSHSFVIEPAQLRLDLQEELNRRNHLAALNIQLQITIDTSIPIRHLYGHDLVEDPLTRAAILQDVEEAREEAETAVGVKSPPDIVTEEEGIRIFVPNLAVGETYWIVFELDLSEEQQDVGEATIQYVDVFARYAERIQFPLQVSEGELPPEIIVQHALGLWTSEVVFYALDDLYQQDLVTAEERIDQHIARLQATADDLPPARSEQIKDDITVLNKFVLLAENLGKTRALDESQQRAQDVTIHSLNGFGRARNGLSRTDYSP